MADRRVREFGAPDAYYSIFNRWRGSNEALLLLQKQSGPAVNCSTMIFVNSFADTQMRSRLPM